MYGCTGGKPGPEKPGALPATMTTGRARLGSVSHRFRCQTIKSPGRAGAKYAGNRLFYSLPKMTRKRYSVLHGAQYNMVRFVQQVVHFFLIALRVSAAGKLFRFQR